MLGPCCRLPTVGSACRRIAIDSSPFSSSWMDDPIVIFSEEDVLFAVESEIENRCPPRKSRCLRRCPPNHRSPQPSRKPNQSCRHPCPNLMWCWNRSRSRRRPNKHPSLTRSRSGQPSIFTAKRSRSVCSARAKRCWTGLTT